VGSLRARCMVMRLDNDYENPMLRGKSHFEYRKDELSKRVMKYN